MAEVDGKAVCAIVPSDREVSLKKLATAFDGKTAKMMGPADAERTTARTGCFAARRVRPITLPICPVIPIIAYIDVYRLRSSADLCGTLANDHAGSHGVAGGYSSPGDEIRL